MASASSLLCTRPCWNARKKGLQGAGSSTGARVGCGERLGRQPEACNWLWADPMPLLLLLLLLLLVLLLRARL
jgi:hypothetical protein